MWYPIDSEAVSCRLVCEEEDIVSEIVFNIGAYVEALNTVGGGGVTLGWYFLGGDFCAWDSEWCGVEFESPEEAWIGVDIWL